MRLSRAVFQLVCVLLAQSAFAQQTTSTTQSSPHALTLLRQSLAALTGSQSVTDVTLTGTARRIAGSDDESGTVTMKALATGEAREDFSFPTGPRSEIRANSDKGPVGKWSGPDATPHAIPYHNLMVESPWFFPPLMLTRLNSSQGLVLTSTTGTRDERPVEHLTLSRQFSGPYLPEQAAKMMQHGCEVEVFLDPYTLLPSAITFNTHPDRDAARDIPVEIRFSDYRSVNGLQVPFHIQKFFNNTPVLDIQIKSAALNTGLSQSSFSAQ